MAATVRCGSFFKCLMNGINLVDASHIILPSLAQPTAEFAAKVT
jgi:hypothetical protein